MYYFQEFRIGVNDDSDDGLKDDPTLVENLNGAIVI